MLTIETQSHVVVLTLFAQSKEYLMGSVLDLLAENNWRERNGGGH